MLHTLVKTRHDNRPHNKAIHPFHGKRSNPMVGYTGHKQNIPDAKSFRERKQLSVNKIIIKIRFKQICNGIFEIHTSVIGFLQAKHLGKNISLK